MRNIYIVLSSTSTRIGKIIRALTRNKFNHSSISLTEDMSEMYSFARYKASNPLVGGFVKEFPERLSFGNKKNVFIEVYKIPVNEEQYSKIASFIDNISKDKEEYLYNSIAALCLLFRHEFKANNAYTCSSFVIDALCKGGVIAEESTSNVILLKDIRKIFKDKVFFSGYLANYPPIWGMQFFSEDFFVRTNFVYNVKSVFRHFYNLLKRHYHTTLQTYKSNLLDLIFRWNK